MNIITKIEAWGNEHRLAFMDYVRVLLGIFITYKVYPGSLLPAVSDIDRCSIFGQCPTRLSFRGKPDGIGGLRCGAVATGLFYDFRCREIFY